MCILNPTCQALIHSLLNAFPHWLGDIFRGLFW